MHDHISKPKGVTSHHENEVAELPANRELAVAYVKAALEAYGGPATDMKVAVKPSDLAWLTAFDEDEMHDFCREYAAAVMSAVSGAASWDAPAVVIEQWRRSAAVLQDSELRERLENETRNGISVNAGPEDTR